MNKNPYKFEDKHGKCLCKIGGISAEVVTKRTREGSGLWIRCKVCGLVLNQTGFSKDEISSFYNEEYQKSNSFRKGSVVSPREHYELAMHSMLPVAKHLNPYLKSDWKVVDIGAATGEFLDLIKDKVNYCLGIELNQEYCDFMKHELGLDSSSEDYLISNYEEQFDLIVLNGTLDHMYNPLGVLDKVFRDLKPGGIFYIQTVNDHQALKEFLPSPNRQKFSKFMYQKAHFISFNENTLRQAVENIGLKVLDLHSRHDYSLKNFLNWYHAGSPQNTIQSSKVEKHYFEGHHPFSKDMNNLMIETDIKFKEILSKHMVGELLCLTATKIS